MKPLHHIKLNYLIDVTGTENVIKIANETKSVKQLIEFSSTSAYGGWPDNKLWIKETDKMRPGKYRYGIHKKIIEEFMNNFKKRKDLKFVTVRMCTAIGPSEYKKGGLTELIIKTPFLVKYDGKYCDLQLLHEYDLTKLIDLIVHDNKIEGIYNLVPDDYCSIKDLVPGKIFINVPLGIVKAITDLLWFLRISNINSSAIQLSAYGIVASPEKLQKRYNYEFKYGTISGFKDAVAGMKKRNLL
jgi:nucleoside-diphosphate-sugar epimerase